MKLSTILLAAISVSTASAFVPASQLAVRPSLSSLSAVNGENPELQAAIAEVRDAAGAFSEETQHFANTWIDKMLDGKQDGMASGLLEECLIDDDQEKCQRFEKALKHLDSLLGVGATEQY